jgi:hypothetical protein
LVLFPEYKVSELAQRGPKLEVLKEAEETYKDQYLLP